MKRREAVAALLAGTMIVLALMGVFAAGLSNTQANSRQALESQAHQRAMLVSNLVDALFGAASRPNAATIAAYSAPHVSRAVLDKNRGQNLYVALFDASGHMLAGSSGVTAQARSELTPQRSATLGLMVGGHAWALGNILPYGKSSVINFGVRLPTAAGPRLLISGIPSSTLSAFLLAELSRIPGATAEYHSVLDGHGTIIASTNPHRPLGYRFHTAAQMDVLNHGAGVINKYYFDQVALPNTTWKLLLSAPAASFFASVSGFRHWLPWVIFAAFGLICLVALLLARRSLRSSAEVLEARDRLASAHEQVSEINARLETSNAALAASNAELERRAEELVRSNSELDHFASIASHDLQEPLRKVRTFTERIRETEGERLSEPGLTYLRRANASAERMQQLIEDLLRYSRVATQGRPFSAVDLGQVTDDVIEDLADVITQSGALVSVGPLPVISADATQMRQLIQNLVSNAIKFRREGVTPQIDIAATEEEGWIKIVVRDNGIGFDAQYARRIFRVFERLHGRGTYPGTGIGLALCRKIAERHGGTVSAESVLGEGATFTVTLQTQRTEAVSETRRVSDHPDTPGPESWEGDDSTRSEESHVAV